LNLRLQLLVKGLTSPSNSLIQHKNSTKSIKNKKSKLGSIGEAVRAAPAPWTAVCCNSVKLPFWIYGEAALSK
jgi:hypothetical protein